MHKLIFALFLATITIAGCATRQHTRIDDKNMIIYLARPLTHAEPLDELIGPEAITSRELRMLFYESGCLTSDYSYWKPSEDWVLNKAYPYFEKFLESEHIDYSKKFDCDDYSRMFCQFCEIYYSKFEQDRPAQAVAVGELQYHPDDDNALLPFFGGSNHAINVIILNTGEVMYFEPQTGKRVMLTETEIKSIYMIKF